MSYEKYKNPDTRCSYPFDDCPVGYCWSYANYVDGTRGFPTTNIEMDKLCSGCEFWGQGEIRKSNINA